MSSVAASKPQRSAASAARRRVLKNLADDDDNDFDTQPDMGRVLAPDTPSPQRRRRAQPRAAPSRVNSTSAKRARRTLPPLQIPSNGESSGQSSAAVESVVESIHNEFQPSRRPSNRRSHTSTPAPDPEADEDVVRRIQQIDADEAMARRLQQELNSHTTPPPLSVTPPLAVSTPQVQIRLPLFNPGELQELARIGLEDSQHRRPRVGTPAPEEPVEPAPEEAPPETPPRRRRSRRQSRARITAAQQAARRAVQQRQRQRLQQLLDNQDFEIFLRLGHGAQQIERNVGELQQSYEALLELVERLGDAVPRGLSKPQLAQLGTQVFDGSGSSAQDVCSCTVCLSGLEAGDRLRILPCSHRFHVDCIDQWLQQRSSCPICRLDVRRALQEQEAGVVH